MFIMLLSNEFLDMFKVLSIMVLHILHPQISLSLLFRFRSSVSRSSTEAEYKALAHCAADVAWIRLLLKDLHQFLSFPPLLHCDNLSALTLCANPVFHTRIKHLDTYFHFVREKVQKKDLLVQYVH